MNEGFIVSYRDSYGWDKTGRIKSLAAARRRRDTLLASIKGVTITYIIRIHDAQQIESKDMYGRKVRISK